MRCSSENKHNYTENLSKQDQAKENRKLVERLVGQSGGSSGQRDPKSTDEQVVCIKQKSLFQSY